MECSECGYGDACTHPDKDDLHLVIKAGSGEFDCPLETAELFSRRYIREYRGQKLYVVVAFYGKAPWEVFIEYPTSAKSELQYMMAGADCITRFVSLSLRAFTLEKVISQLNKSSRSPKDLPGILSEILSTFSFPRTK